MTDKEILERVYEKLREPLYLMPQDRRAFVWKCRDTISYIEQEWQRQDELDDHPLTKSDEGQMYNQQESGMDY